MLLKKNKTQKGGRDAEMVGVVVILNSVHREDFSEKVTSEQRPERGEGLITLRIDSRTKKTETRRTAREYGRLDYRS